MVNLKYFILSTKINSVTNFPVAKKIQSILWLKRKHTVKPLLNVITLCCCCFFHWSWYETSWWKDVEISMPYAKSSMTFKQFGSSRSNDMHRWIRWSLIGNNGLSPVQCQAIISTNTGLLLFGHLGTNFSEIWMKINISSFKNIFFNILSAKWQSFCLSLNVLR